MRNKLSFSLFAVIATISINTVAYANLWNLSDTDYTYIGSDKSGETWIYTFSISSISGKDYYKATMNNYENDGETNEIYLTSNATSVQYSYDGTNWEYWIDLTKNTNNPSTNYWITTEVSDTGDYEYTKRVVGYDTMLNAYFVANYEASVTGEILSKADIYYFFDGRGMVYEYDERGVDESIAPLEQLRTDWRLPTPGAVPEPTTLLLFSAGLLSLTAACRRRAK